MFAKPIALGVTGLSLMVSAATVPASAEDAQPDSAGGRYIFNKTADGFVRLDTQSGEVALCRQKSVGWACEAAPEDRAVLESEIARLRGENVALKRDLLSRGLPLPPGAGMEPSPPSVAQNQITIPLPSDADIGRAVEFAGRIWHRFIDAVRHAQQQILNKS
jgi:hypothetical protein